MDKRTIFSKTGKGSLEIAKKNIKLSSEERQALILVDGKSNLGDMEEKLSKVAPAKLRAIFEKLLELDLIREFITKGGPDSIITEPGGTSMQVQEITEEDLDFTALAPVASANTIREIEARRLAAENAERQAREDAAKRGQEQQSRQRVEQEALRRAEAAQQARAAAEAKVRAEVAAREQTRLAEEAKRKAEAEQQARAAAEAKARAEVAAREQARVAEDAKRKAEAEQQARAAAEAKARAEVAAREQARVAEEAKRKAEAEHQARAAAEAKAHAEATAREQARLAEEATRKAEAERAAREAAERKAKEETEARERTRLEEEARRKAEAERAAREAAERQAKEETEARERARLEEEARRKAEAERAAREAAERKAREETEARERARLEEEARRKAEAERAAREAAERKAKEEAEARERARQAETARRAKLEAEQQARAEAERKSRADAEARERTRLAEEARRQQNADHLAKEEAQRKAIEESQRKARDESERRRRDEVERQAEDARRAEAARSAADAQRLADEEAARYTAALTPHLEAAAPGAAKTEVEPARPGPIAASSGPAPMGAFANLSALESGAPDSLMEDVNGPQPPDGDNANPVQDKRSRKEIEQQAKANARAEAKKKKEAELEAKRLAKADKVSVRGPDIGVGKIVFASLVLVVGGVLAYLLTMSADRAAIEKALSARFGQAVTVGEAKFDAFPPELRLSNVSIGDIMLPRIVAVADPSSMLSSEKIWKNVDVTGVSLNPAQAGRIAAIATVEVGKSAAAVITIQRLRFLGVALTGTPAPAPKFDLTVALANSGAVKQATFATADGKAQLLLAPDEKGWSVDFESRATAWSLGPKAAWDSMRAKGIARRDGVKLDELAITHFGGTMRGAGDLSWGAGWKFSGNVEINGMDVDGIAESIYGAGPVAGGLEGKFSVNLAADSLAKVFDTPQIEGGFVISKAVFKTLDFARAAQGGDPAGGQSRFPELTGALNAAGGRLQLRQLRGTSGLVNVSGSVDVLPDRSLAGTATIELGAGGARGRSNARVAGTVAEPRLTK